MLSNCLDSTAVSEIGLRSSSILRAGVTFGMGITVAHFQSAGIYPSRIESLNMAHMGGAKFMAWSLKIQFGISSGPIALLILMAFSSLVTVSVLMIYVTGTLQLVGRVPMSRGFSSLQTDSKNKLISSLSELIFPSHNAFAIATNSLVVLPNPVMALVCFHQRRGSQLRSNWIL